MISSCVRRQLSGKMLGQAAFGCFALVLLGAGCSSAPPPVDTKAAEDAVRAADAQWSKAAGARDVAAVTSYYADGAIVLPPNAAMVTGKADAQKAWAAELTSGNSVSWTPATVVSSASGDMVYDQGTYSATMTGPDGKPITDKGKYLCVWKKQADGSWKAVADTWNSDMAAAPVAAAPTKKMKKRG